LQDVANYVRKSRSFDNGMEPEQVIMEFLKPSLGNISPGALFHVLFSWGDTSEGIVYWSKVNQLWHCHLDLLKLTNDPPEAVKDLFTNSRDRYIQHLANFAMRLCMDFECEAPGIIIVKLDGVSYYEYFQRFHYYLDRVANLLQERADIMRMPYNVSKDLGTDRITHEALSLWCSNHLREQDKDFKWWNE
jgi:hypothetical protein